MVQLQEVPSVRQRVSDAEWQARIELAAAYRLVAHYGWTHLINNHISLRVPGTEDQFLINPYGFLYEQITASSLVKIDVDGNILDELALPREPRRLRHPQRDPHGAPRPARHHPHPHRGGPGGVGARLRAAAAQPELRCATTSASAITSSKASRTTSTSASASSPISATTSA